MTTAADSKPVASSALFAPLAVLGQPAPSPSMDLAAAAAAGGQQLLVTSDNLGGGAQTQLAPLDEKGASDTSPAASRATIPSICTQSASFDAPAAPTETTPATSGGATQKPLRTILRNRLMPGELTINNGSQQADLSDAPDTPTKRSVGYGTDKGARSAASMLFQRACNTKESDGKSII